MTFKIFVSILIFVFCNTVRADYVDYFKGVDWELIKKEMLPPTLVTLSKHYPEQSCKSNISNDLALLRRCRVELEQFRNEYLEPYNQEALKYQDKLFEYKKALQILRKTNQIGFKDHEKYNLILTKTFEMFEKTGRIMQPYFEYSIKLKSTAKWVVPEIQTLERQQLQFGSK